ncbi:hypothetical protein [Sphaerisporangium aureirubrum]|uniref:Uncharacterized protein n=1 Tax=Sphaerisporangium aureirubrum TaxID=1544736 RepID=A0ABW1ND51_9ACTN
MLTTVTFDAVHIATFTLLRGLHALYNFNAAGKIHAQPAYLGQPGLHAVTITLGTPPLDHSGYHLTGLQVGTHVLTGVVMCTGPALTPGQHPHYADRCPLTGLPDDTRTPAAVLLAHIAQHFHSVVAPH